MKRKKLLQDILIVVFLLIAVVVLFCWFTAKNSVRMEEQNKKICVRFSAPDHDAHQ